MADANNRPDQATIRERVHELSWALVDDRIDSGEIDLLESLLLSDDGARNAYLDCMQLHVDLMHFFADAEAKKDATKLTSVMGFLSGVTPPTGLQPPIVERNY